MFRLEKNQSEEPTALDILDRAAIVYLVVPLVVFMAGWFEWWVAVPCLLCLGYGLKPLMVSGLINGSKLTINRTHILIAVSLGSIWTILGGTDHLVFANADWHTRDAVLHDLVVSSWPVGYGPWDGSASLLRAPIAYYLPAALLGKVAGIAAAHVALSVWTACGAILFLLQVLTVTRPSASFAPIAVAVVIFFSGLDIVGSLIDNGPRFRSDWTITSHLEWWAHTYQYSSMTTQLFWVPNHALCGWLMVGLFFRNRYCAQFEELLPMLVVVVALWSPFSAIGILPFVAWQLAAAVIRHRSCAYLLLRVLIPALCVGLVVASYLALDINRIPRDLSAKVLGNDGVMEAVRQIQFFLLEAGIIGLLILLLRRSIEVLLALTILALLPLVSFGAANDLVMRASIPSLTVLAISASIALTNMSTVAAAWKKKLILGSVLAVGAITPMEEIARAAMLPAWPANLRATLIGVSCNTFSPNYVARLKGGIASEMLRYPSGLAIGPQGPSSCENPALELMWQPSQADLWRVEQIRRRKTSVNASNDAH